MVRPRKAFATPGKSLGDRGWRIFWRDGKNVRRINIGAVPESEAEHHRLEIALALRTGKWPAWARDTAAARATLRVGEALDVDNAATLEAYHRALLGTVSPGWAATNLAYIKRLASFAGRPLTDVTPKIADAYLSHLTLDLKSSAKTRNNARDVAGRFYRWAVRTGRVRSNPFDGIKRLRVDDPSEIVHLTREERDAVLTAANGQPYELAVWLGLYAGLRRGEIARCEWAHIRVDRRKIDVPPGKTGKRRSVDMAAPLAEKLKAASSRKGRVVPWSRETWLEQARCATNDLASRLTEIPKDKIRWNVFRHTFASILVQAGVSIFKVASWLGNDVKICTRHYASMMPDHDGDIDLLG